MQSPNIDFETEAAQVNFETFVLLGIGSAPEEMTQPWDPPLSYPNLDLHAGPRCRSCGAMNPANSIYCNQCATALGCAQCGSINRLEDRFCTQCGTELMALGFEL
jgi:hypothetical protein